MKKFRIEYILEEFYAKALIHFDAPDRERLVAVTPSCTKWSDAQDAAKRILASKEFRDDIKELLSTIPNLRKQRLNLEKAVPHEELVELDM